MPDDINDICRYYNSHLEEEDQRLTRHQQEHDITRRYLDKFLPKTGRILEVGCATGVYTIPLARHGYDVTAVDLSPEEVKVCKDRAAAAGLGKKVGCYIADARDLKEVPGRDYDAALLMGPLYHLVEKEDREQAVRQVHDRLKPGGVIFSSFVSRYGIWGTIMAELPHLIHRQEDLRSVMKKGKDVKVPEGGFRGYFATAREAKTLHTKMGFKTLVLAGVEPANTVADKAYNALEPQLKKMWLDFLFSISTEPSIIGASDHLLYIGVK